MLTNWERVLKFFAREQPLEVGRVVTVAKNWQTLSLSRRPASLSPIRCLGTIATLNKDGTIELRRR